MKTAKVKVFCPECGAIYVPELTQVKDEKKEIDGKLIFLKYFNCQACNAQNYIQVDNNETLARLELCKKQIRDQITANRKGRKGKQSGIAKKTQIHLRNNRKALQLMLKDKITFANYEVFEDEV